jgi:hypothetical protein
MYARVSKTFNTAGATGTASVNIVFSDDAIDGDPGFTDTPILCCRPGVQVAAATQVAPKSICMVTADSVSADFVLGIYDGNGVTMTINYEFMGGL